MEKSDLISPINNTPIQEAVKMLSTDPGALFQKPLLEQLQVMREKCPAEFARVRQLVKDTKVVSMSELDKLTTVKSEQNNLEVSALFPEVEPWTTPVDGVMLLDDILGVLQRYVIADKPTLEATALWCLFTWFTEVVLVAPIANITAPEKRCGKTIMLTAMGKLSRRSLQVSNMTPAPLFRSIEMWSPTLLIDEVDTFLNINEEARGILNSGFTRDSATLIRCVGDDHTPTPFNVWGAKALCGIGKIADTLSDRSIPLRLRRKKVGESVQNLRHSDPAMWDNLVSRIARFAEDNMEKIKSLKPTIISGLHDRANDCWEPLLQVAEAAGGTWPARARVAAVVLHGVDEEAVSVNIQLLSDIKEVFDHQKVDRLFSHDLLLALTRKEESLWATWNRGKQITARQLANRLSEFGISSGSTRIGGGNKKGYRRDQFNDAFERYLGFDDEDISVTPSQVSNGEGSADFLAVTTGLDVTVNKTVNPSNHGACDGVTDDKPLSFL